MQQYFTDQPLHAGETIELSDEILYHLKKVLRKDSSYLFRICDSEGRIFLSHLTEGKNCLIGEILDENNELDCRITCILSLIRNEKMEFCIQKLTELGVSRIVPYQASRSVVKAKDSKKIERFRRIAREAAEQCHRNRIPEISDVIGLKQIGRYLSRHNYICYESEKRMQDIECDESITYVIGPEGGFEETEYETFVKAGFESVSLGKRILRAETAAIYVTCLVVGKSQ